MDISFVSGQRAGIDPGRLLALANRHHGRAVDCDMRGTPITDFAVLLHGAYGPAVMRVVNLAVARQVALPLPRAALVALAQEAFAQAEDFNFAQQRITDYTLVLQERHGFGRQLAQLVALAREHAPVLTPAAPSLI
jgi:hypothetical protein